MDPEEEFDELHWAVIDVLKEGRATPSYLAERTGESRQLVSHRLRDLRMGDYVEKIHKGLYELSEDPRAEEEAPGPAPADTGDNEQTAQRTDPPAVADPDVESDLEAAVREYLEDRPPKKRHAKEIVVDALLLLRENEYMETGDIQEQLYADYEEHYSTERTMWNAVSRYLRDLPGFEKPDDYGGWSYAGDDAVWEAVRGE